MCTSRQLFYISFKILAWKFHFLHNCIFLRKEKEIGCKIWANLGVIEPCETKWYEKWKLGLKMTSFYHYLSAVCRGLFSLRRCFYARGSGFLVGWDRKPKPRKIFDSFERRVDKNCWTFRRKRGFCRSLIFFVLSKYRPKLIVKEKLFLSSIVHFCSKWIFYVQKCR